MKKIMGVFFISSISGALSASNGAVCTKCEEIREYNKTHHQNYEYFEDFENNGEFEEEEKEGATKSHEVSTPVVIKKTPT